MSKLEIEQIDKVKIHIGQVPFLQQFILGARV